MAPPPPPPPQSQQGGSRASKPAGAFDVAAMETGGSGAEDERATSSWAFRAAVAGVALVGLAGAGVLVWWALAFHPATQQLWMVPVGLVLLGTPLLAWLSLFASSSACRLGTHRDPPPPPMPMPPER